VPGRSRDGSARPPAASSTEDALTLPPDASPYRHPRITATNCTMTTAPIAIPLSRCRASIGYSPHAHPEPKFGRNRGISAFLAADLVVVWSP
jgi:hypothetical protein